MGIPGTTQTDNGYDTELGTDAICWKSSGVIPPVKEQSTLNTIHDDTDRDKQLSILFANDLIQNFTLPSSNTVKLLTSCPTDNVLTTQAPLEWRNGGRLRTGTWYNYTVSVQINLQSLGGRNFISDRVESSSPRAALQIITCSLTSSGFCSPFIHDEANARLQAEGILTKPGKGDSHGGTHVHSPRVFVTLDDNSGIGSNGQFQFTVDVPMLVNHPGNFFAIAAVQIFVTNQTVTSTQDWQAINHNHTDLVVTRYDMANAMDQQLNIVTYQTPQQILSISQPVAIVSYIIIGGVALTIAFLLVQTILHRDHQVLKLTQGTFLIACLSAALIATVATFLLQPVNDVYCQTGPFLVMSCLQIVFAITIGRLWRIHAVISPLLMQTLRNQKQETNLLLTSVRWIQRSMTACATRCSPRKHTGDDQDETVGNDNDGSGGRQSGLSRGGSRRIIPKGNAKSLRRQVNEWHLLVVVALFSAPQIILQIIAIVLQPRYQTIYSNDDESIGREICKSTNVDSVAANILYYSYYLFLLLVIVLMLMAHATRRLPSLFNETKDIFDSTLSSIVLLVLGIGIIAVTHGPTTSPSVEYLIQVLVILSLTLNMSWRLMMPKLRMVWRNETVLVSKLVSDHAKSIRRENADHTNASASGARVSVSGLEHPGHSRNGESSVAHSVGSAAYSGRQPISRRSTRHSNSVEVQDELEDFGTANGDGVYKPGSKRDTEITDVMEGSGPMTPSDSVLDADGHRVGDDDDVTAPLSGSQRKVRMSPTALMKAARDLPSRRNNNVYLSNRIVVSKNEAPARRLVLKMVDLQEQLNLVNERIMSGLAVSEDDWTLLRSMTGKMGATFHDEVEFEWEREEKREGGDGKELMSTPTNPSLPMGAASESKLSPADSDKDADCETRQNSNSSTGSSATDRVRGGTIERIPESDDEGGDIVYESGQVVGYGV